MGDMILLSKPKTGDFIIIALVIILAIANIIIFVPKNKGRATAQIIKDGKITHKLTLDRIDKRVEVRDKDKYNILIVAEDGRVRFEEANCPDHVCVDTGWISKPGQSAACVPGGIIINIIGEEESDTDIILR